ncbi:MAG: hypothetical protein AAGI11_21170 [Pseudomonadota bacterium]
MLRLCYSMILLSAMVLSGCGTTDSAMRDAGKSDAYVMGFHDGRHSGLKEAGNPYESYIRDQDRFEGDADYKAGWLAGEAEGKKLQAQAEAVGNAAAAGYSGYEAGKHSGSDIDKAARDAVKGVDTSDLKVLEKP